MSMVRSVLNGNSRVNVQWNGRQNSQYSSPCFWKNAYCCTDMVVRKKLSTLEMHGIRSLATNRSSFNYVVHRCHPVLLPKLVQLQSVSTDRVVIQNFANTKEAKMFEFISKNVFLWRKKRRNTHFHSKSRQSAAYSV